MFSNSLCKYVNGRKNISVYSEMQLTVSKFYSMLCAKRAPLSKLQIVILHLGFEVNNSVGRGKSAELKNQRRIRVIVRKYRQILRMSMNNYNTSIIYAYISQAGLSQESLHVISCVALVTGDHRD